MNTHTLYTLALLALGAFLNLTGCTPTTQKAPEQLELTVLIDPSDRIAESKHPAQSEKDLAMVQAALEYYSEEVEVRKLFWSSDRIQVALAPQESTPHISDIIDSLTIDMEAIPDTQKSVILPSLNERFLMGLDGLYERLAMEDQFSGADIYEYLSEDFRVDTVNAFGERIRNVLIIVTDGYLVAQENLYVDGCLSNHIPKAVLAKLRNQPNWEDMFDDMGCGLIPIDKDYHNLEVLVIGVNPKNYFNEFAILQKYWVSWFHKMGIRRVVFAKNPGSTTEASRVVHRFLEGR